MPYRHLLLWGLWIAGLGSAQASTFIATTDTLLGLTTDVVQTTSDLTDSLTDDDDKVVRQARDDAAVFVGSGGAVRGVYLEAALKVLRHYPQYAGQTDAELAAAILAQVG